jgi:hypothetical protein
MKTYNVKVTKIWTVNIEAKSKQEALEKVNNGEGEGDYETFLDSTLKDVRLVR